MPAAGAVSPAGVVPAAGVAPAEAATEESTSWPSPAVARALVIALLLLAFGIRLAYLLQFRSSPLFTGLVLDEENYDKWAQAIAGGEILGRGVFTSNPLSPYVLGLIYALGGHNLFAVRVIQMMADTASCYFMYRITLRLVDQRAALVTLLLAGLYGPMIYYAGNLLAEVWVIFFSSASLMSLVYSFEPRPVLQTAGLSRAERKRLARSMPATRERHTLKSHLFRRRMVAGTLFALACLGRPNLMLMAPLLPLAMTFAEGANIPGERFRRALPWMTGIALVLGPVYLRNLVRGGDGVLITAHGGVNLWIGNNPEADGFFKTPRDSGLEGGQESLVTSSIRVAEREEGHRLKPSEASDWWQARAIRFALNHPGSFIALTAKKAAFFFNAYEKPLETNYHYGKLESSILRDFTLGFGFVSPLGLVGMVLLWPRRRSVAVLYIYAAVYSLGVIAFFVSMRYRLPIVTVMLPFAGAGAVALYDGLRAFAPRVSVPALAAFAGGLVLTHLPLARGEIPHDLAHTYYTMGNLKNDKGLYAEAIPLYEKAVSLYPEWGNFYNNLGLAYIRTDQPEKAVAALKKALELDSGGLKVQRNLAKAYRKMKKPELAAEAYREALKISPKHVPTLFDLGETLEAMGQVDEAKAQYKKGMSLKGSTPERRAAIQQRINQIDAGGGGAGASAGEEGDAE